MCTNKFEKQTIQQRSIKTSSRARENVRMETFEGLDNKRRIFGKSLEKRQFCIKFDKWNGVVHLELQ
jgi:hypothetical protein